MDITRHKSSTRATKAQLLQLVDFIKHHPELDVDKFTVPIPQGWYQIKSICDKMSNTDINRKEVGGWIESWLGVRKRAIDAINFNNVAVQSDVVKKVVHFLKQKYDFPKNTKTINDAKSSTVDSSDYEQLLEYDLKLNQGTRHDEKENYNDYSNNGRSNSQSRSGSARKDDTGRKRYRDSENCRHRSGSSSSRRHTAHKHMKHSPPNKNNSTTNLKIFQGTQVSDFNHPNVNQKKDSVIKTSPLHLHHNNGNNDMKMHYEMNQSRQSDDCLRKECTSSATSTKEKVATLKCCFSPDEKLTLMNSLEKIVDQNDLIIKLLSGFEERLF